MNTSVLVIFICFILSGFFHQVLYILFPLLTLYYIIFQKASRLTLNPVSKIYLYIAIVAVGLFIIQSILYFDIKIFSIKGCLRYVAYFSFAVLVSYLTEKNIKYFFLILIAYFILTLPMGYYQTMNLGRYQNVLGHSNHLAYILSILIYFLVFNVSFKSYKVNIICIVLIFVSLILTKSSGGLLVLIALLGYNGIVSNKISFLNKITFSVLPIIMIVLAVNFSEKVASQFESLNFLTWDFIENKVTQVIENGVNLAGGYGSFIWRVTYWFAIVNEFISESFIKIFFGVGVDHLTQGNMPYKFMKDDPHNDFIKAFVEFGAIGLFLFIGFFRKIYKIINKNFNIIILIIVPVLFGNPTVNFSVSITFILILMYEYKKAYNKA